PGTDHQDRQSSPAPAANRSGPSRAAPARRRGGAAATSGGPTGGDHRAGGPGAAAPASALQPVAAGSRPAAAEGGDRVRSRVGRLCLGGVVPAPPATAGAERGEPGCAAAVAPAELVGDEPARWRWQSSTAPGKDKAGRRTAQVVGRAGVPPCEVHR